MEFLIKAFFILNFIFLEIKKIKSLLINKYKNFREIKIVSLIKYKIGSGDISFKDENINSFLKKNTYKKKTQKKYKNKILIELLLSHHSEPMINNCLIGKDLEKFYNAECIGLVKKNDLLTRKIAESFGINKFEFIDSDSFFLNLKFFIISLRSISCNNIENKIFNYKKDGYELGKSALENYYRFYNSETRNINKFLLYLYLSRAIKSNQQAQKIFKKKFKIFVLGENQFIPNKILFHCALKNSTPVYTYEGSASIGFIGRLYKKYEDRNLIKMQFSSKLSKLLSKIFKNQNLLKIIKKNKDIKNIGKETIWSEKKPKKTYSFKDRKQFNKFFNFENNKKNILFLPHAMSDNIFNNEWNIFKTSYNWFYETISEINNLNSVNWIIKPHPYEYKFPGVTARDVFNEKVKEEKKNIFFLNENIHINEIYKYVDVVLTGNGSAGFEYPSLGIPTITTSDAKYSNFKFTYAPKYKKDYFDMLKRLDKLKKPNKQKIKDAQIFWLTYNKIIRNSHYFLPKINQHGKFKKKLFFKKLLSKIKFKLKLNNFSKDINFQLKNNNRHSFNISIVKKYKNYSFKLNDI